MGRDVFTLEMTASRFRASKAGVYHGLGLRGFKNLVIKGACLSRILFVYLNVINYLIIVTNAIIIKIAKNIRLGSTHLDYPQHS